MFDKNSLLNLLPDLKGSALSIVLFLALKGDRTVSMNELTEGTGFSDKPVKAGLKLLMDRQIVTRPRVNRYQLTGKNLQLPLYWGETIEALPGSGETPNYSGDFPELMQRVRDLEARVWKLENRRISEFGEIPGKSGETPKIEVLPYRTDFGEIPGKSGETPKIEVLPYRTDFGETPGNFGETPNYSGETPKKEGDPIKELINIYENKEVSKYVDTDTYLHSDNSNDIQLPESGETPKNPGDIPELFSTAWKVAMQQMESQMGRGSFMDILHGAVPTGYEDGHYTIMMDNQFKRDWAEARLTDTLEKILTCILGVKVSVSFVVDHQEPAADDIDPELPYEAPSLELIPEPKDPKQKVLTDICNEYLLDPTGIAYSKEQLQEMIKIGTDPDVLRFLLPRMSNYEAALTWCCWPLKQAKHKLLTRYKIIGAARSELTNNPAVSLETIYEVCEELCPDGKNDDQKNLAIYRIKELSKEEA